MEQIPPRFFTPPANVWQWLMLLVPALICMVGISAVPAVVSSFTPVKGYDALGYGLIGLCVAAVVSLALGFWLARKSSTIPAVLGMGILYGLGVMAVNTGIGFAGCASLSGLNVIR